MAKTIMLSKHEKLISKAIKSISNQRTQEIIKQRFGLEDGQRQTLEAIGKKYNITRERVRQIEGAVFFAFKKNKTDEIFKPILKSIDEFFIEEGGSVREERLLFCLTNRQHPHPDRGGILFILNIAPSYQRFFDLRQFHPFWVDSKDSLDKVQYFINVLVKRLEQKGQVFSFEGILALGRENDADLSEKAMLSYLDISKKINQNNFYQFGLSHWSEIKPRGVKDKAYLILKKENQPLHFRKVADLINQNNLGSRFAHPQTVHNELIKDSRFVLVGRGTYALSDWGYQPGTVQETIINILKKDGPLTKTEILNKVLENRLVKENTILINLQNRKWFIKDREGRYILNSKSKE